MHFHTFTSLTQIWLNLKPYCQLPRLWVQLRRRLRPKSGRLSGVTLWGQSSKHTCHLGAHQIILILWLHFWWSTLHRGMREFATACSVCAHSKESHCPCAGHLHPLPVQRWILLPVSLSAMDTPPSSPSWTTSLRMYN